MPSIVVSRFFNEFHLGFVMNRRHSCCIPGLLCFFVITIYPSISSATPPREKVSKSLLAIERLSLVLRTQDNLATDIRWGYLPIVLQILDISPDSQTLVFSKTSFQQHRISPRRPRAIYFNDTTYVGWVRDSPVIEFAVADPDCGVRFYTLTSRKLSTELEPREGRQQPLFERNTTRCVACHDNSRTLGVPGFLVRSIICNPDGRFVEGAPTSVTDHTTPFEDRWGGWYVTGNHGQQRHSGNALCTDPLDPSWIDKERGANQAHLPDFISPKSYLRPTSDILALMVLAHETQMHNHLMRLRHTAIACQLDNDDEHKATLEEKDRRTNRLSHIADEFVRYMLFLDEPELTSPITSSSPYRESFEKRGPWDGQGRTLRKLDGTKFLFTYPCSFLIYSESFDSLPQAAKHAVGDRLRSILVSTENDQNLPTRFTRFDCKNIAAILKATKHDFWQTYVVASPGSM